MKKIAALACTVLTLNSAAFGQLKLPPAEVSHVEVVLTGQLCFDLQRLALAQGDALNNSEDTSDRKSPLHAALMSAVIPGAGEIYAGSYWRGAAFIAAEAALWILYATYEGRGDDRTRLFELFADDHFSVVLYAQWLQQYATTLNPNIDPADCSGLIISNDPNRKPWERIDWAKLNRCEEAIGARTGTGFTHRLPRRPDQQYYELIGKYEQYSSGWDDATVDASNYLTNLSARFLWYRDMRAKANDYYNLATTVSYMLVANHLLSAFDAAWSASQYNRSFSLRAHLQPTARPFGFVEFVPTATVTVDF
jgi:hypothetical protein